MKSLITQRVKIGELEGATGLLEFAQKLVKDPSYPGRKLEDIELIRKFFVDEKAEKVQEGQISHIISTSAIDRDKEIMLPKGADFKAYRKNPIVLWGHDYRDPANIIGKNLGLTREADRIKALTEFDLEEFKAARIYGLYQRDFLKAWSVGFVSVKGKRPDDKENPVRYIHEKWALLEYSAVGVPANPEALTEAVGKGYDLGADLIRELELTIEDLEIKEDKEATLLDLGTLGGGNEDGKPEETDEEKAQKKKDAEGTPEPKPDDAGGGHKGDEPRGNPKADPVPQPDELTAEEMRAKFIGAAVAYAHIQKLPEEQITAANGWANAPGLEDFSYTKNDSGLWDIKADTGYYRMDKDFTFVPWEDGTGDTAGRYPWETVTVPIKDPYDGYTPHISIVPDNTDVLEQLKELREQLAEFKAGRVLSAKNRGLITKATLTMRAAVEALEGLLAATDEEVGGPEPDKTINLGMLLEKEEIDLDKLAEDVNETLDIDALVNVKLKQE